MTLKLSTANLEEIKRHGRETYPEECCGALIGALDDRGNKEIKRIVPLQNAYTKDIAKDLGLLENERGTRNRYVIDPKDLFATEKEARAQSMSLIGFYHSHPDHPAVPSKYDLRVASAGYSYVIVSVEKGHPKNVTCWQTDAEGAKFDPEDMVLS